MKEEENKLTGATTTWTSCKHYGVYFKHWYKKFFICISCRRVFTNREIKRYKKLNEHNN